MDKSFLETVENPVSDVLQADFLFMSDRRMNAPVSFVESIVAKLKLKGELDSTLELNNENRTPSSSFMDVLDCCTLTHKTFMRSVPKFIDRTCKE